MNKLLVFLIPVVAAKVYEGWRDWSWWRININVQFTLTCVLPGTTKVQSIEMGGNKGPDQFAVISQTVFKVQYKSGQFEVWAQASVVDTWPRGFKFDWIQVLHNSRGNKTYQIEIGKIQGQSTIQATDLLSGTDIHTIDVYNRGISYVDKNIDIHVNYFCINFAFIYWSNPIGFDHHCISHKVFPRRPNRQLPIFKSLEKNTPKKNRLADASNATRNITDNIDGSVITTTEMFYHDDIMWDLNGYDKYMKKHHNNKKMKSSYVKPVAATLVSFISIIIIAVFCYLFYRIVRMNR